MIPFQTPPGLLHQALTGAEMASDSRDISKGAESVKGFTRRMVRCVDNDPTYSDMRAMKAQPATAEVNIHLRAKPQDRRIIDQAAALAGLNRSQFMLASALKEAKTLLLDQSTIHADTKTFQQVMDWLDQPASSAEVAGMARLARAKMPWPRG
jgi:uncharacterized protein (DUF1778 family)